MTTPESNQEERPRRPREPELYMPAMPPLGLIHAVETRVKAWVRRGRQRRRA